MQAKRITPEKQFEPIEIKITLETEEEAKTMYSLFNNTLLCKYLYIDQVRYAIGHSYHDDSFHNELWDCISQ